MFPIRISIDGPRGDARRFRPAWTAAFLLAPLLLVPRAAEGQFLRGADLSALEAVEEHGGVFTEGGAPDDPVEILRRRGLNAVRLRIWHTPWHGYDDLPSTLASALRMKEAGLDIFLDFHYSDTWADPSHQQKPAAWASLPFEALKDSVYAYTFHVVGALAAQNTSPALVQLGNEITGGMLWDDGRTTAGFDTPQQWQQLAELVGEGVRGVKDALPPGESAAIVLHTDRGGDNAGARYFVDRMIDGGVEYDMIGLSFYPWWHGTLADLAANVRDLATRYGREVVLAEAAYPWTLAWADTTHNVVGDPSQLLAPYDATEQGQRDYLLTLVDTLRSMPAGMCRGWFYWAPEWLPDSTVGSPWENLALFDFAGEVLDGADALGPARTVGVAGGGAAGSPDALATIISPNPFFDSTRIRFSLPAAGEARIDLYDVTGREVKPLLPSERRSAGPGSIQLDAGDLPSGVYFVRVRWRGGSDVQRVVLLR